MPLSTHTIATASVGLSKGNDFKVRGLSFPDITFLVENCQTDLIALVAKFYDARQRGEGVPDVSTMGTIITSLARDFPSLATEIISNCVYGETMDDGMREKVRHLSAPVQIDAMVKIAKLTLEEGGGLKNLLTDLRQRLQGAAGEAGLETENPVN